MPPPSETIPVSGQWPVDPQQDVPISEDRIWIDGCFDFAHHGHAGAMLQARRLGTELLVGVHSDEAILDNKGPTVMNLKERVAAVDACRWATKSIPHAPYVTSLPWISHYGCQYVVHGDDITSDSSGEDCYRFVKAAGRFKVVKRTPGISTTDLVGRMLLCTKSHFIKSLDNVLLGNEGSGSEDERKATGKEMRQRIVDYATDETGHNPGSEVWSWHISPEARQRRPSAAARERHLARRTSSYTSTLGKMNITSPPSPTSSSSGAAQSPKIHDDPGSFHQMVLGKGPRKGQRIVYVDGGFDLFSSGHIAFLRSVVDLEEAEGKKNGWYTDEKIRERISETGENYGPAYILAGVHEDEVINYWKGVNYPIMNIFERGLCVLQCKYINALIFGAPFTPTPTFLRTLPHGLPAALYHGPTAFMPLTYDPYTHAKELAIFCEVPQHDFQHVNAGEIVDRILKSRAAYEARQRAKGEKAVGEEAQKRREREREEQERERARMWKEVEGMFGG
ncbi:phosphoethanolamine [Patellaria atrata CBS 101060]|uniref:ethanolamine-phosphate cytidylyltransferase n=1 Tax=Patellaria atrata CBS 101060 TaxID=1346257 RepID=A0A9P4VPD4_9PEZI|nr:phosphoethanolamine [Patellaria atrata CBS 101060]